MINIATYEQFKSQCYLTDLPNAQFFDDNGITLISTRTVIINDKQYNTGQTPYYTNVISYVNLSLYKYIFSIRQTDAVVGNYNVFNIVVNGIKHTDLVDKSNLSIGDMSTLCLEKSDEIEKLMMKFLK